MRPGKGVFIAICNYKQSTYYVLIILLSIQTQQVCNNISKIQQNLLHLTPLATIFAYFLLITKWTKEL